MQNALKALLFDLDGTLIDTAPDLAFALNTLLQRYNRPPISVDQIRPQAGHGGNALIELGFNMNANHPDFKKLRNEFLNIYRENHCIKTQLFPGILAVLQYLAKYTIPWGIVTNKPTWLTEPLLDSIPELHQASCLVCGDTLAKCKPHPEPIWHACRLLNVLEDNCVYIGDAERDIQAGNRAGLYTIAVRYGYIPAIEDPQNWHADEILNKPSDILTWLKHKLNV